MLAGFYLHIHFIHNRVASMLIFKKRAWVCLNKTIFFFPVENLVTGTLHDRGSLWLLELKIEYDTQYKEWNLRIGHQINCHLFHILSSNE